MIQISYRNLHFPPSIVQQAVWMYVRFNLSLRDVEELLAERDAEVSYETVRRWVERFGPQIARRLRRSRGTPHPQWHLDEMYVSISGQWMYLWRAVNQDAAQIVQGYAAEIVQDLNRTISAEQNRPEPPSLIVARNWFNPNLEYHWFTVSSLIGKTVPSLIVGLFNGTIFLLIATLVFQIPFTGSILLLYASLTVYMISVIVNGLFTKDMPLGTVFENAWPLIVIALVTMTSAGWLFRRRME